MSNRDDSLDIFLQKLDAINSFCESRGDESQHACDGCILSDYCVDIPTRESYKAAVKSTDKCMELIRKAKEEDKDVIQQ